MGRDGDRHALVTKRAPYGSESRRDLNPQPRVILEIADCSERIELEFEADSQLDMENSLRTGDMSAPPPSARRCRYAGN